MTDKLPPLATQIVAPSQTAFPAFSSVFVSEAPELKKQETAEEEEPYTIKCICDFSDDDGQTIFCETCQTWQHIVCYYPGHVEDALREDFAHSCVDCKPRLLDSQKARERQRARLAVSVVEQQVTDRKPKRPPAKSHKKKPKPTELQLQSHSSTSHDNPKHPAPHDQPPPKKSKSSHKASQSISSQAPKRSPSYGNPKANPVHPPSPATTPPDLPAIFQAQSFSSDFLSQHDDRDVRIVNINSYKGLSTFNTMSAWVRDQGKLLEDTGCDFNDVFQKLPSDIELLKRSDLIERRRMSIPTPGGVIHLPYLVAKSSINKDMPLMELNGQIGVQKDYCVDPAHRWVELSAPLPFVFFPPMLPIFIDTRQEGSKARYVRRSCKPNAVLDTFIAEGSEYHFWLVSERPIAAEEQITIPWDFRFPPKQQAGVVRLLGLDDEDASSHDEDIGDEDAVYELIANWRPSILAEYGGCACNLGPECAFARFHRKYMSRVQPRSDPPHPNPSVVQKKKTRKPKTQHTVSPTSTGPAMNSRTDSEGRFEDGADNDNQSQSSSSRSKPPSRDMTPARQGSFDTLGILTEPTDRDKRKVAMVEDSFRRMEQQQPPRKKKRTSDGTGSSKMKTSSKGTGPNSTNTSSERRYVDAGTSRSKSHSPSTATSPHLLGHVRSTSSRPGSVPSRSRRPSESPRANYCDAAVQTDPVEDEWYSETHATPKPRKRIISLSKRLLNSRHQLRLEEEERRKQSYSGGSTTPMDIDSPTLTQGPFASPSPVGGPGKHVETTASTLISPREGQTLELRADPKHPGPAVVNPLKHKSPDLRVQMPPVPAFGSSTSFPLSNQTPLSATSPVVQSPYAGNSLQSPFAAFGGHFMNGNTAVPSPVKKKMSLSDYMNKVQAAKPSVATVSLKTSHSTADEPKSASSLDSQGAVPSPSTDNKNESEASSRGPCASASANGVL